MAWYRCSTLNKVNRDCKVDLGAGETMEVNSNGNLPGMKEIFPMRTFAFYQNLGFFPGGQEGQSRLEGRQNIFFNANDGQGRARANPG
jgi:hypothetical protein